MIAKQKARFGALRPQADQPVDHLRQLRPAIDEVAQENKLTRYAASPFIGKNLRQQSVEQIEMAMNVADRIDAASLGYLSERSEEHTSELQSLMRISYAVFCWKKKNTDKSEVPLP